MADVKRSNSIDAFRLIAAFAVVTLHVSFGAVPFEATVYLRLFARFAVPFFFIVTGYFFYFGYNRSGNDFFLRNVRKLLNIFIVSFIIFLPKSIAKGEFNFNSSLLINSTDSHLWFIPSLIFGLVFCWYFMSYIKVYSLLILSSILFLLPVTLYFYGNHSPLHTFIDLYFSRFIVSISFLSVGLYIAHKKLITSKLWAILITLLGIAVLLAEVYVFEFFNIGDLWSVQFLIFTLPLSIGLFFLSFHVLDSKYLGDIGRKFSLSLYLYHPLVNSVVYHAVLFVFRDKAQLILTINPVLCFFSTLFLLMFIEKYVPRLFQILNGEFTAPAKPLVLKSSL